MPRWIPVVLIALALLAITVPAIVVRNAPRYPAVAKVARPKRVVPQQELPPVEPVEIQSLSPEDARAYNASIPFSTDPNPAARPFRLIGEAASRARAIDCLAAAVIYEAGDDASGERAVAQVVLNRARHPAFPKTICGVVFQGSERSTGCQFTFTCDGAMVRAVNDVAWKRARDIADAALAGRVDRRVGQATHYHTDWVVPYWSASLDKITEIHTHLFFRWTGWWGTPPAFNGHYGGVEPNIPQMSRLSPAHVGPGGTGMTLPGDLVLPDGVELPTSITPDENSFLVTIDPRLGQQDLPALAARACGERPFCKFMAWTDKAAAPTALPITPAQQAAMAFSYLRDRSYGFEKSLWNCTEFPRPDKKQCMKADAPLIAAPPIAGAPLATPGTVPPPAVPTLTGVRRKAEAAVAAPPASPPAP